MFLLSDIWRVLPSGGGREGTVYEKSGNTGVLPLFILQKICYRAGNDTGPVRITWQQRLRQLPVLRLPCCCFR